MTLCDVVQSEENLLLFATAISSSFIIPKCKGKPTVEQLYAKCYKYTNSKHKQRSVALPHRAWLLIVPLALCSDRIGLSQAFLLLILSILLSIQHQFCKYTTAGQWLHAIRVVIVQFKKLWREYLLKKMCFYRFSEMSSTRNLSIGNQILS